MIKNQEPEHLAVPQQPKQEVANNVAGTLEGLNIINGTLEPGKNGKIGVKSAGVDIMRIDRHGISVPGFADDRIIGTSEIITTTSFVDMPGTTIIITPRQLGIVKALFSFQFNGYMVESVGNTGNVEFCLDVDGNVYRLYMPSGTASIHSFSSVVIVPLNGGVANTIKLKAKLLAPIGSPTGQISSSFIQYLILGGQVDVT